MNKNGHNEEFSGGIKDNRRIWWKGQDIENMDGNPRGSQAALYK